MNQKNPTNDYPTTFLNGLSQKAEGKVKDRLPIPTYCPCCLSPVILKHHSEVYGGRVFSDWPWVYACTECDARVGLHKNTDIPLGMLADEETRKARMTAKTGFKALLMAKNWDRSQGYTWLAKALGIEKKECHFGWFDYSTCCRAFRLISHERIEETL